MTFSWLPWLEWLNLGNNRNQWKEHFHAELVPIERDGKKLLETKMRFNERGSSCAVTISANAARTGSMGRCQSDALLEICPGATPCRQSQRLAFAVGTLRKKNAGGTRTTITVKLLAEMWMSYKEGIDLYDNWEAWARAADLFPLEHANGERRGSMDAEGLLWTPSVESS